MRGEGCLLDEKGRAIGLSQSVKEGKRIGWKMQGNEVREKGHTPASNPNEFFAAADMTSNKGMPHPMSGKRSWRKNGDSQQCGATAFSGMTTLCLSEELAIFFRPVMKLFEHPAKTTLKARKTANMSLHRKEEMVENTVKAACVTQLAS